MASTIQTNFRVRHAFAKIAQIIGIPDGGLGIAGANGEGGLDQADIGDRRGDH